jgi:hypothetical protein
MGDTMADEEGLEDFSAYYKLGEDLIEVATKQQVAEAGRILAMHVAVYHRHFGPVPQDEIARCMSAVSLSNEDKQQVATAMTMFAESLAVVISDRDEDLPSMH